MHILTIYILLAGCLTRSSATDVRVFNEPHLPDGLRKAKEYAGSKGFIASLPEIFKARVRAPFDNEIWNNWFTTMSEESVVFDKNKNKTVVVLIHGGGILSSPNRVDRVFSEDGSGMTDDGEGRGAALLSDDEADAVVQGKIPGGRSIKMYAYDEFVQQNEDELPRVYGIVLDFDKAKASTDGYTEFSVLEKNPLFISRAGGVQAAARYLAKLKTRSTNSTRMGNWHPFARINASIPQCRITFLSGNLGGVGSNGGSSNPFQGYDSDYGIGGDANINNRGRFVGVRAESSTTLRDLPFVEHTKEGHVRLEANAVFEASLPAALWSAQWQCVSAFGNDFTYHTTPATGRVASIMNIVRARIHADFTNDVWTKRYAALSDQSVCQRARDGSHVVVTVHGGGLLGTPERIMQAFKMDGESLTGQYAAKLSEKECNDLLERNLLPNGHTLDTVYDSFDAFANASSIPERFAVVADYEIMAKSPRGYVEVESLRDDPWFLVSVGSVQLAREYLNKISNRSSTVGNWPPFEEIFWHDRQSRVLFLDTDGGVLGTNGMINEARFVSLAPTNASASIRKALFD